MNSSTTYKRCQTRPKATAVSPLRLPSRPEQASIDFRSITLTTLLGLALLLSAASTKNALASDELNRVQTLIYGTAHLTRTSAGQDLVYRYESTESDGTDTLATVTDTVTLSVIKQLDENRRDLSIDFLTEERRMALPDFPGFKGNPVIIAMLEDVSRYLGNDTGGGVVYFRNRIRDAMATEAASVEQTKITFGGKAIDGHRIDISPFSGDTYLTRWPELLDTTITIELSDSIPGSLVRIDVASAPDGELSFKRQLVATE